MGYTEYVKQDYLVVAGRMTRVELESVLFHGFTIHMWASSEQVAVALVVKTLNAAESSRLQHQKLYTAGQVCVHFNPDSEIVGSIVLGVLTHDVELLGPLQVPSVGMNGGSVITGNNGEGSVRKLGLAVMDKNNLASKVA